MRSLLIAVAVLSLSYLLPAADCEARGGGGGGHHAAPQISFPHTSFTGASAHVPTGSNGYAYHPVGAGYFGRRGRGRGGYGGYGGYGIGYAGDNNYHNNVRVDNSFDEWNRAESKRLSSIPKSSIIKEYIWPANGIQQLAGAPHQVAAKATPAIH